MRQIGTLSDPSQAQRFVDFLTTQEIDSRADEDAGGWVIWVMDEEQVQEALAHYKEFSRYPDDPRFAKVAGEAERIRRQKIEKQQAAAKNVVEMRGQWSRGLTRKAPAMFMLMAATVLVGLVTGFDGGQNDNRYVQMLSFRSPATYENVPNSQNDGFYDIKQGQLWRLATPILLHIGPWHLLMNMYWLWYFGSQIEDRRGTLRFLLLVLLTAVIPNVLQAVIESPWFAGMSGVDFGLFGYVWMRARFDPKSGLVVSQLATILLLASFFACFTGLLGPIANTAHGGGLFVGVVIGYLPELAPALRKYF